MWEGQGSVHFEVPLVSFTVDLIIVPQKLQCNHPKGHLLML